MTTIPSIIEFVVFLEELEAWDARWSDLEAEYGNYISDSDDFPELIDWLAELREKRRALLRRVRNANQPGLFDGV